MKFYKLAIGARFTSGGVRYTKCGMSAAADERRRGHLFFGIMEVAPEGEPLLLPPEEAAKWKPHGHDTNAHELFHCRDAETPKVIRTSPPNGGDGRDATAQAPARRGRGSRVRAQDQPGRSQLLRLLSRE